MIDNPGKYFAGKKRLARMSSIAAIAVLCLRTTARAQDDQVQHRLPAFQAPASDSLETAVLARLKQTGEYLPDDLPRLARLAVLESISMLVNVRADLRDGITGNQLEEEITALWNDSQAFYEFVTTSPNDDAASVARASELLAFVDADYRQVQGSFGALPAVSDRAFDDLRALTQLLGHVNSLMGSMEANAANQAQPPAQQGMVRRDSLRAEAQITANLVVALIGTAGENGRGRPGRDALVTDLTDLLERLQDFCRLVSIEPPLEEIRGSFSDARRQMWRTESRLTHLPWRAGLLPSWRQVRDRMNAISDALGLPRVIVNEPPPRPLSAMDRSLAAHVDHAVAWLDEYLAENSASFRKTPAGTQFQTDAVRLRHDLLELRRRALENLPAEKLKAAVQEIVRLNDNLSERALQMSPEAASTRKTATYKNTAEAVRKLGGLVGER